MVDPCPCCAPPWTFQQSPMKIATLGIVSGVWTLSVYSAYTGQLLWTVDTIRHNSGSTVGSTSVCFGSNQRVYVTQTDVVPAVGTNYYLYEYDRDGNFVSETSLLQLNTGNFPGTLLASNSSGLVAVNAYSSSPRVYATIVGGNNCVSPVNNVVRDVVDVDDDGYIYTQDDTYDIYRWDSSGTYVQTLTNPLAGVPVAMSVSPDGAFLWVASSTLLFGSYINSFKKVSIPGNTVLATNTTITATKLRSISVAPWGTRYDAHGSDNVATGSQGGLQINITGTTLTRNLPGQSPTTVTLSTSPGSPRYGNAVSID